MAMHVRVHHTKRSGAQEERNLQGTASDTYAHSIFSTSPTPLPHDPRAPLLSLKPRNEYMHTRTRMHARTYQAVTSLEAAQAAPDAQVKGGTVFPITSAGQSTYGAHGCTSTAMIVTADKTVTEVIELTKQLIAQAHEAGGKCPS